MARLAGRRTGVVGALDVAPDRAGEAAEGLRTFAPAARACAAPTRPAARREGDPEGRREPIRRSTDRPEPHARTLSQPRLTEPAKPRAGCRSDSQAAPPAYIPSI